VSEWRIRTEAGGLAWVDPGPDQGALRQALGDCVSTLSPRGEAPGLSSYWIDRLLDRLEAGEGEVAHGNLWVFTLVDQAVEIRMDVDDPASEPLASVDLTTLIHGLRTLRAEVQSRIAAGHVLDDRHWSQQNPG